MSLGRESLFRHKVVYNVDVGRSIREKSIQHEREKASKSIRFPVLHLLIKYLVTKLRTNRSVHQVLLYVNSTEKVNEQE